MGSQRTGGNSDGGSSDEGGAAPTPDEPNASIARDATTTGSITEGDSRSTTPSSRSVTPLSPIQESSAEVVVNSDASHAPDADLAINDKYSTDASGVNSQWQSGVKPTESDAVSSKEIPSSINNHDNAINDEEMDNSSAIKQKTALTLNFPKLTSKAGKYVHTKFNHSTDCALTNNLLTGVPKNAILFDNGATVNCAKTNMGRLLGSFESNGDGGGGISVGDETSTLESQGSYLHAINIIDADGASVSVLLRMEDTPKAICSIFSEPEEVYKRGGRFDFTDKGRLWVLSGGNTMRLHMTANHLAWAKFSPITDSAQVRELLCQNNTKLIMVSTSATLGEVLQSCKKMESADNEKGRPIGWAAMCVHVDDCPGVSSSDRLTEYIKAGIMVQYECKHGPWKKVLGFKFTCTNDSVTMSAEHTIETMYNTYLINHPNFDARMPTWYQNLRVLSAHPFGLTPERRGSRRSTPTQHGPAT